MSYLTRGRPSRLINSFSEMSSIYGGGGTYLNRDNLDISSVNNKSSFINQSYYEFQNKIKNSSSKELTGVKPSKFIDDIGRKSQIGQLAQFGRMTSSQLGE